MYICKLGKNPTTGSEDNAWKQKSGRRRQRDMHQKQYIPPTCSVVVHIKYLALQGLL